MVQLASVQKRSGLGPEAKDNVEFSHCYSLSPNSSPRPESPASGLSSVLLQANFYMLSGAYRCPLCERFSPLVASFIICMVLKEKFLIHSHLYEGSPIRNINMGLISHQKLSVTFPLKPLYNMSEASSLFF